MAVEIAKCLKCKGDLAIAAFGHIMPPEVAMAKGKVELSFEEKVYLGAIRKALEEVKGKYDSVVSTAVNSLYTEATGLRDGVRVSQSLEEKGLIVHHPMRGFVLLHPADTVCARCVQVKTRRKGKPDLAETLAKLGGDR